MKPDIRLSPRILTPQNVGPFLSSNGHPCDTPLTRRQALGILAAPFVAGACGFDKMLAPLRVPTLSTMSASGVITLIGGGDQHALRANPAHRTGKIVKAALDADPAAWAFAVGDLVPNGTAAEYQNYDVAWGAFKDRTLFAIGNHDRKADPSAKAYYDYVGDWGGPRGKGYYAVTLGTWRIYVLNSEAARSEEQVNWLAADLPNWTGYHIMAMWHTPRFASVCAHNGRAMTWPRPLGVWWKLLQDHGAEFVVSGHVHRWERFPRMLRDGTVSDQGIRQFIAGTGGVKPMEVLTVHPHSEQQIVSRGVVRFDLHPDRYEWRFTDLAGVVRDEGSEACRLVPVV